MKAILIEKPGDETVLRVGETEPPKLGAGELRAPFNGKVVAVKAEPGEKIVFSWMTWPDKATADAGHDAIMNDPRMAEQFGNADGSDMPFDGKRMIFGGFDPMFTGEA